MDIILSKEPVDFLDSELLITGFFQDEKPLRGTAGWIDWRLNGRLSRFLIEKRLTGVWEERILIPSEGRISARLILLLGLGSFKDYTYLFVREIVSHLLVLIRPLKATSLTFSLPYGEEYGVDCDKLTAVVLESIADHLDQYPSDRPWIEPLTLLLGEGEERFSEILFGVQAALPVLKDRFPVRMLTPSEPKKSTR